VNFEPGLKIRDHSEYVRESSHYSVKVEVDMIGSYLGGEPFGSLSCFFTGILGAHEAGVEYAVAYFLAGAGKPGRALRFGTQPTDIFDNLLVALRNCLDDFSAHRVYDNSCSTAVNTSAKGKEKTSSAASSQIVPKPTSWAEGNFFFWSVVLC
jgi:hypothetical protein